MSPNCLFVVMSHYYFVVRKHFLPTFYAQSMNHHKESQKKKGGTGQNNFL